MTDAETIARLTAERDRLLNILASIAPDQVPGPFICGTVGKQGPDGLHDAYMICPTYGADIRCTALYVRSNSERSIADTHSQ